MQRGTGVKCWGKSGRGWVMPTVGIDWYIMMAYCLTSNTTFGRFSNTRDCHQLVNDKPHNNISISISDNNSFTAIIDSSYGITWIACWRPWFWLKTDSGPIAVVKKNMSAKLNPCQERNAHAKDSTIPQLCIPCSLCKTRESLAHPRCKNLWNARVT